MPAGSPEGAERRHLIEHPRAEKAAIRAINDSFLE
jgi:hypothetical protein